MKQIVQHLNTGETSLLEVPAPQIKEGHLLVKSLYSLVSAGTEQMLIDFGKANWINKARQQPDKVKMVLDKVKTDGLKPTIDAVLSKINKAIPLGYANAGIVVAVGENVRGYAVGDRVASNGAHAEMVQVPQNLVAKIPNKVLSEDAAFTVVAAIALQGIRLAQPTFGETFVVFGLGLIGQITVQLLKANGCKVIGIDPNIHRCKMAENFGALTFCNNDESDIVRSVLYQTQQRGADAVIITATTADNSVISDAAKMSRKRGRIVLVGVVGLQLQRADFYEKELTFQVSSSYGAGRYEYDYEQNGNDYPIGFVRWTAQRNFEAVLQAMENGLLNVSDLVLQKIPIDEYEKAYQKSVSGNKMATLFQYSEAANLQQNISIHPIRKASAKGENVAVLGAGNFTAKVILPQLVKHKLSLAAIASGNGLSAAQLAKQFEIATATTDVDSIMINEDIGTVFIATPHHLHGVKVVAALQKNKNIFVEKPLAISLSELEEIKNAYQNSPSILHVGFNRRFAPLAVKMKNLLGNTAAQMNIVMTVNAGEFPANHWLADAQKSGGRIVGEVCHFIDFAAFLAGDVVAEVCTNSMGDSDENVSILLRFANGSNATIHYFANGNKAYDKERIEVFSDGKILILENWKKLTGYGFKGFSSTSASQDKGHANQFKLFALAITQNTKSLIPFSSIMNTSYATLAAVQSLKDREWKMI